MKTQGKKQAMINARAATIPIHFIRRR